MSTSLQRQLKDLRTPQTTLLQLDKKRPSLLFDPREAANLDRDAVFEIGISGLEELKQLNPRFGEFEKTLFAAASKTFERSVQSTELNREINAQIDEFLVLVSPYFVLRPAQKALEWLVNRYHVHQFNLESWLVCVLPHHDTRIFVRALQLLDLSDSSSPWHWLFPLQKPGIPLPKLTLLKYCARDLGFLKFVCSMMSKALDVHQENRSLLNTYISFYTTTVIGAIEYSESLREEQITVILPAILEGLDSQNAELIAGAYMIIAQMSRKATFNQKAIHKIVSRIIKGFMPSLALECVTLLAVLYDVQKASLTQVPSEVLMDIATNENFVPAIASMASEYRIASFVGSLIESFLLNVASDKTSEAFEPTAKFLKDLFSEVKLEGQDILIVVRSLLQGYLRTVSQANEKAEDSLQQILRPVLEQLERQYPGSFEAGAQEVLNDPESGQSLQKLEKLLGLHYDSDQASLFLKLNHISEKTRAAATKALVAVHLKSGSKKSEFVASNIIDRLKDTSPAVVEEVLKLGEDLLKILDDSNQLELLISAVASVPLEDDSPWKNARRELISLVCGEKFYSLLNSARLVSLLAALLRHLFPATEDDVKIMKIITTSPLVAQSALLRLTSYATSIKVFTEEEMAAACLRVFEGMWSAIPLSNPVLCSELFEAAVKDIQESTDARRSIALSAVSVACLECITDEKTKVSAALKLIETFRSVAKDCPTTLKRPVLEHFAEYLKTGSLPLEIIVYASSKIMDVFPCEYGELGSLQWLDVDSFTSIKLAIPVLLALLDFWTSSPNSAFRNNFRYYTREILSRLKGFKRSIVFLSSAWAGHLNGSPKSLQLTTLRIATTLFQHTEEPLSWATGFDSYVIPHLLAALTSPDVRVRQAVLSSMKVFTTALGALVGSGGYKDLVETLCAASEELESDSQQLRIIVSNIVREKASIGSALVKCVTDPKVPDHVKVGLLTALEGANTPEIFAKFFPLMEQLLDEGDSLVESQLGANRSTVVCQLLERFAPETSSVLQQPVGLRVFRLALNASKTFIRTSDGELLSPQAVVIETITKEFFASISTAAVKQQLFSLLLDITASTESPSIARQARKALKRITVDAGLVVQEIRSLEKPVETMKLREARTRRTRQTSIRAGQGNEWTRILSVLEIVQSKKKMTNVQLLVSPLFDMLKKCVDEEEQASLEYSKQLILSCLLFCCERLTPGDSSLSAGQFNTSLIVQCIRVSNNPQTHNHALLLLSLAAQLFPSHVLHNIMAIFTFMGTSVLRQDDAYSFQVIKKTVESVIPALIQASQKTALEPIVTSVMHVFADALREVPEHRRIPVFDTLLSTLGPDTYLWLAPTLVLANTVTGGPRLGSSEKEQDDKERVSPDVEFCLNICHQYKPQTQLKACVRIVEYLQTLPLEKEGKNVPEAAGKTKDGGSVPFNVETHTTKQLCHFKLVLVNFLTSLLSSDTLIGQLLELDQSERVSLEDVYSRFVETILQYTQSMARIVDNLPDLDQAPNPKFWRILLHRCYDVVDRINSLLPSKMFITVVHSLLSHNLASVRRRAMELISAKIQHQPEFFSLATDQEALLQLIPVLVSIARGSASNHTEEASINQQTALLTLKLLCRLLCSLATASFKPVLEMVTDILDPVKTIPQPVLASAFLCLADLVQGMGIHALPLLPKFAAHVVKRWENKTTEGNDLLLLSVVTAVSKLVEVLPQFLIPYVVPILHQVCLLSVSRPGGDKTPQLQLRLQNIRHALATSIPARILVNAVSQVFADLTQTDDGFASSPAVVPLMSVLSDSFASMSREDLSAQHQTLTTFFLRALDSRTLLSKDPANTITDADTMESAIVDALVAMILKLSEASFRPLLFQLFDWATREETGRERLITFYNTTFHIAERLKGLFVLFAGHFIRNAADIVMEINTPKKVLPFAGVNSQRNSALLLEYILRSLYRVCLHDNENFINKERFDILMQPLVDQLENELEGEEKSKQRVTELLVPLLAQLAVAAADDSLWKALHYQILLKTRNNSHLVRLGALSALGAFVEKLGEDYLALLPEAIPFLAELLEDDSNEVEIAAQNTIQHMENILGEPLQKYF